MITPAILEKAIKSLDQHECAERTAELQQFHHIFTESAMQSSLVITFLNTLVQSIVINSIGTPETTLAEAQQKNVNAQAAMQSMIYFGYRLHSLEMLEGVQ